MTLKAGAPALMALLLVLGGCQPSVDPDAESTPPFVFRTLHLRQRDPQGAMAWELRSPEARYDLSRKLAHVSRLDGLVYEKGQPLYKLSASRGVVLNDGDVVLLEGPIRLERLGKQPLVITAERLRWYPHREWMTIDRHFVARQKQLQVTALRAGFDLKRHRLQLDGTPQLSSRGPEPFAVAIRRVVWWAESGDLLGDGAVRGHRRSRNGAMQTLLSPGLSGNSLRQELLLASPLTVTDAQQQARLQAGATTIRLQEDSLLSRAPFTGMRGRQSLQGEGFELQNRTKTLRVLRHCRLQQPGDQLSAQTCSWNWESGAVRASGQVTLQRRAQGLITRAEQLHGRVGQDGLVVLDTPSGVVSTTVTIKRRPGQSPRRPAAKPAIQL